MVSNRRIFTRLNVEDSVIFFEDISSKLDTLHSVVLKSTTFEDLVLYLSSFSKGEPCSFIKLIYEKQVVPDYNSTKIFDDKTQISEFLRQGLFELYPFLKKTFDEVVF